MKRRHLIALSCSLFLVRFQPLHAQITKLWRIGYLAPFSINGMLRGEPQFLSEMAKLGYIEGRNFVLERRSAETRYDRLDSLAQELVSQNVDVIVAINTPAAMAAKRATTTIPIIFGQVGDPVAVRLIANLARPGGNVTGVTDLAADTAAKRLAILKEIAPSISRVAVLWDPSNPISPIFMAPTQAAAKTLDIVIEPITFHDSGDADAAFEAVIRWRADAIAVFPGTPNSEPRRIAEFALKARLPSVSIDDVGVREGLLLAYNANLDFVYGRMAVFIDKVLKGTNPADLPTEQPTRLGLIINLRTARELGLAIPNPILSQAEELID